MTSRHWILAGLIVSLLGFLPSSPTAGRGLRAQDSTADPKPEGKVLRLKLSGPIFENAPPLDLFGGAAGASLREIAEQIRLAAKDERTEELILEIDAPLLGWTQLQSVRRELLTFRESGKPSRAHLTQASAASYILASACTEVSLLPVGLIEIPGLRLGRMYMKELLDKCGVEMQELRAGRYKSAVEGFTRNGPSDPVREETQAILDDLFEDYVGAIAENRGLEAVLVRGLIDHALFQPEEALEAKLIDRIEYPDEFLARVTQDGVLEVKDIRLGKQLKLQGGFAGMMTLMNELFGGPRRSRKSKDPKLAVVYGDGAITTGGGPTSLFGGQGMTSKQMVKVFRELREDDTVKAVVFRVNSPGGSALASDLIWREVKLTNAKKPVVVSMGDYAASGGYYISAPARYIFAEAATLTGSIGVIGAVPNLKAIHQKAGLRYETYSRGKRAEMNTAYGELTDEGRKVLTDYIQKIYGDFLDRVAEGRKLPRAAVAAIAEGRVWTGKQAKELGLVDELGGLEEATVMARKLGGLEPDVEVLRLPRPKNLFDLLSEAQGVSVLRGLARELLAELPRELQSFVQQLEWVRDCRDTKAFAVPPTLLRLEF